MIIRSVPYWPLTHLIGRYTPNPAGYHVPCSGCHTATVRISFRAETALCSECSGAAAWSVGVMARAGRPVLVILERNPAHSCWEENPNRCVDCGAQTYRIGFSKHWHPRCDACKARPRHWACIINICDMRHDDEPASFSERFNHHSRDGHGTPRSFIPGTKLVCQECYGIVLSVTRMVRALSGEECKPVCRRGLPVKNAFNCECVCVGLHHSEGRR